LFAAALSLVSISHAGKIKPDNSLEIPQETLQVAGRRAILILPPQKNRNPHRPMPWVWYAPTLPKLPAVEETWMFERFLENGIAIAGVDVGESYGSPAGREGFTALYRELTEKRGFSRKPCLLARSRGGLMHYNWAAEHPECVSGIAGIYPVGNLKSWPGLAKACGAYGMTAAELETHLSQHNPLDRLAPLAMAGVPIFHIHGDSDDVVPLAENSEPMAKKYRELGGSMRLRVTPGQGHNMWKGFFQSQDLVEFVINSASPAAEREPSAALFREPPMDARPGAFWDWLNGNVNLARLTEELEEMKAKGMSGAEIWDIGILRPHPDAPVPAGPEFLGPESMKAVNHALDEADRLGLQLGIIASSSWNAGGSWVEPKNAMKGLFYSEITVKGPGRVSQLLPMPQKSEAKNYGNEDPPSYTKEIAVLAFPKTADQSIPDANAIINLTDMMDREGNLIWDAPAGEWVIQRFTMANTGQRTPRGSCWTIWMPGRRKNIFNTSWTGSLRTVRVRMRSATWKWTAWKSTTTPTGRIHSFRNSASGVAMIPSPICPRSRARRFQIPSSPRVSCMTTA
jgi:pimeloyl-ACP methyl ester carboxylesterase